MKSCRETTGGPGGIMPHEVGPTEKDKYSIISHVGSKNQRQQNDAETNLPIREGLNLSDPETWHLNG